ncbi:MAG: molybdopterin-binding protein [Pseudolabrys sp.]
MAAAEAIQTITRLTPLAEVLAMIDSGVKPVAPRSVDVAGAAGRVLATEAVAPLCPSAALALVDGWALAAADTVGAGGYAPVALMTPPQRVEAGQAMPPGTDGVAPLDAVTMSKGRAEALVTINPGDGVLAAGGDSELGMPLRSAGERLRATDVAALASAGIARVDVRAPRIHVAPLRGNEMIAAVARLVAGDVERRRGEAMLDNAGGDFDAALTVENADAIVTIGGTGSGRNDASVRTLARKGRLAVHGMALTPGETAALGFAGMRPVLLLPGRLDAALAVWLTVGRRMLDRLAAAKSGGDNQVETLPLARKVTSTVGLAELVPVRRTDGRLEPLAAKYLPLSSLSRSDGWILVPADSEGFAAGTQVPMRPWP